jgi:hypothetical protein
VERQGATAPCSACSLLRLHFPLPQGRERMGSSTLQTLQDRILLLLWVCFEVLLSRRLSKPQPRLWREIMRRSDDTVIRMHVCGVGGCVICYQGGGLSV